jgi:hypothetical protein
LSQNSASWLATISSRHSFGPMSWIFGKLFNYIWPPGNLILPPFLYPLVSSYGHVAIYLVLGIFPKTFFAVFGSKLGEQKRNPKNGTIPIIL